MKLKPCPFCGGVDIAVAKLSDGDWYLCRECEANSGHGGVDGWNTRPIEDELRAEINKLSTVYVVTMYRFGDREKHSYVLGVWSDKAEADKHANAEVDYRGGKYKADVLEVVVNAEPEGWEE